MSPQACIRAIAIVAAFGCSADVQAHSITNPEASASVPAGSMAETRSGATAAGPFGQDGRLLVAGGSRLSSAEPYRFTGKTNNRHYAPGEDVTITGSAWQPGGEATLLLHDSARPHDGRSVTAVADTTGGISNDGFVPEPNPPAASFVTAKESVSQDQAALTAAATPTDGDSDPQSLGVSVVAEADVQETEGDEGGDNPASSSEPSASSDSSADDLASPPPDLKQDNWAKLLEDLKKLEAFVSKVSAVFAPAGQVISWIETAKNIINLFSGFSAVNEFQVLMEEIDKDFGALHWWLVEEKYRDILVAANSAADEALWSFEQGQRLTNSAYIRDSKNAAQQLENAYLWSLRWYDPRIDSGLDREGPHGKYVYDWRLPVPAFMQAVAMRLTVLAASEPEFKNSQVRRNEILGYRDALKGENMLVRMNAGVSCDTEYVCSDERPFDNHCRDRDWYYDMTVICRDKYGKLFNSATFPHYCFGRFPDPRFLYCPDSMDETIKGTKDPLERRLRNRMPFFQMQATIDGLYRVTNPNQPDLTEIYPVIQPSHNTSLCLEAHRGRVVVGGIGPEFRPVALEDCNGSAAQRWVYDRTKFTVLNPESGKCLAAQSAEPKPKTWIVTDTCDDSPRQQWTYDQERKVLLNGTGTVLDVQWGKLEAGTPLWTWDPNGGPAQQFESGFSLAMYVPVLL